MGDSPQLNGQVQNFFKFFYVMAGNGGIDLEFEIVLVQQPDPFHRPFIGTGHLPEGVVLFCGCAVDGDAEPLDAGCFHPGDDFRCQKGSVGGHDHAKTHAGAFPCQIKYVFPQKGFSAR